METVDQLHLLLYQCSCLRDHTLLPIPCLQHSYLADSALGCRWSALSIPPVQTNHPTRVPPSGSNSELLVIWGSRPVISVDFSLIKCSVWRVARRWPWVEFVGVSGVCIRRDAGFRLPHCSSKVTLIPRDAQESLSSAAWRRKVRGKCVRNNHLVNVCRILSLCARPHYLWYSEGSVSLSSHVWFLNESSVFWTDSFPPAEPIGEAKAKLRCANNGSMFK